MYGTWLLCQDGNAVSTDSYDNFSRLTRSAAPSSTAPTPISLNKGYADDASIQRSAVLADKVCYALYELNKQGDQVSRMKRCPL